MATAEDWLAWEAIRHQVALAQYSNGVVYRIMKLLNASDTRLLSELEMALQGAGSVERIERLESLLYAVRATNAAAFEQVGRELAQELQALVQYEAAYQAQVLTAASPVGTHIATVNVHQVYAAAYAQPFRITKDGAAPVAQLLNGVSEDRIKLIRQAISMGMVEGEPIAKMVQRIRGTRATNYADGLLDNTRRHVETLVRTSVNHMANVAQQSSLEANEDIMAGWVFTATLDGRTTLTCASLNGKRFPVGKGPIPPRHFNCRSYARPALKTYREMGIDLPEVVVKGHTRASKDGQVAADLTFSDWLRGQPQDVQKQILGATRAKLFRANQIDVDRFTNNKGVVLSLDQLRKKDSEIFKRAGL